MGGSFTPELKRLLLDAGCHLNDRAKVITKSGIRRTPASASP